MQIFKIIFQILKSGEIIKNYLCVVGPGARTS